MNFRMIFKILGAVLCVEAACMVPSLLGTFNLPAGGCTLVSIVHTGIDHRGNGIAAH